MVSITYGHKLGFLDDCIDATLASWVETESGLTSALTCLYDDWFKIEGTCDNAADEYAYYERDISALAIGTTTYQKFVIRWKTSVAASGLGARVQLIFTDGTQDLLESAGVPQFSTVANTWMLTSGTITSGKTIDKVRLYADDYPDTIASGTFQVYYDFVMLCKGIFTFPNVGRGIDFEPAPPRDAVIPIPGRDGDITQGLGSELATVNISCDLASGNWKRTGDYRDGQVFIDIAHNSGSEAFQWLDTEEEQFKVRMGKPVFRREGDESEVERIVDLMFREYRRSNAKNESEAERYGLNL